MAVYQHPESALIHGGSTIDPLTGAVNIHIEPGEVHYVINRSSQTVKMVSTLAPYQEVDKVEVDSPVLD